MKAENSPIKKITIRLTGEEAVAILRKGKAKGHPTLTEAAHGALLESIREEASLAQQIAWNLEAFSERLSSIEARLDREIQSRSQTDDQIAEAISETAKVSATVANAIGAMTEAMQSLSEKIGGGAINSKTTRH
jgi:hypothetical protein